MVKTFSKKTQKQITLNTTRKTMRRIVVLIVIALCATVSAPAQDWAKARLEKSPRHGEWVKIKQGNRDVESFITYPEVKEKATAVVIIHEIFGLSDWVRGVTDQLAEAGYIAIAPDLLSGMGPKGGGTADLGGSDGARKVIVSLPPDQITADLNAVVDYVSKLPACNGKVVVMGFCWGGGQSFRFATNNKELKAALVFYGTGPDEKGIERIQMPGLRLLRRQRRAGECHDSQDHRTNEEGREDLRTGHLRRGRPRIHARRGSAGREPRE
jgi:carboxymethylenebutenolidase